MPTLSAVKAVEKVMIRFVCSSGIVHGLTGKADRGMLDDGDREFFSRGVTCIGCNYDGRGICKACA